MAKLYFNKSDVVKNQILGNELLELVERGIVRTEEQRSFRSFYDIEIIGVAVYYRKNWRYEGVLQEEAKAVGAKA